jgi:hypothetical protein
LRTLLDICPGGGIEIPVNVISLTTGGQFHFLACVLNSADHKSPGKEEGAKEEKPTGCKRNHDTFKNIMRSSFFF